MLHLKLCARLVSSVTNAAQALPVDCSTEPSVKIRTVSAAVSDFGFKLSDHGKST